MPETTTTTPQFAAAQRAGAQQISTNLASVTDLVIPHLAQSGKPQPIADVFAGASRDLVEIISLATQIVTKVGSAKSAEEKSASTKVLSVVAAVVLVVVAVVIAAFTFGAGAALVALAVIAAAAIIGGCLAAAQGADVLSGALMGRMIGASLVSLVVGVGTSLLTDAQAAIQRFTHEQAVDAAAARSRLLRAILQALRQIDQLTPQMDKLTGPCLGDPPAVYATLQDAFDSLQKLLSALRRTQSGAEAYAVMSALEALVAALKKAMENLRPSTSPGK